MIILIVGSSQISGVMVQRDEMSYKFKWAFTTLFMLLVCGAVTCPDFEHCGGSAPFLSKLHESRMVAWFDTAEGQSIELPSSRLMYPR